MEVVVPGQQEKKRTEILPPYCGAPQPELGIPFWKELEYKYSKEIEYKYSIIDIMRKLDIHYYETMKKQKDCEKAKYNLENNITNTWHEGWKTFTPDLRKREKS